MCRGASLKDHTPELGAARAGKSGVTPDLERRPYLRGFKSGQGAVGLETPHQSLERQGQQRDGSQRLIGKRGFELRQVGSGQSGSGQSGSGQAGDELEQVAPLDCAGLAQVLSSVTRLGVAQFDQCSAAQALAVIGGQVAQRPQGTERNLFTHPLEQCFGQLE